MTRPASTRIERLQAGEPVCATLGCDRAPYRLGLCQQEYGQLRIAIRLAAGLAGLTRSEWMRQALVRALEKTT